jgi:putative FmdB family regulatory protein
MIHRLNRGELWECLECGRLFRWVQSRDDLDQPEKCPECGQTILVKRQS